MKLAIMQPYIFPYIGYFQLMHAVNKFVYFDDVNFIKRGWINRNRILLNGRDFLFTIPLQEVSQFKYISQIKIRDDMYISWKAKFYNMLKHAYKKAPFFDPVFDLIENVLEKLYDCIASLARQSVQDIITYIGLEKIIVPSSVCYNNRELSGQERILDICKKEKATVYINPIGGLELYSKNVFETQGIKLQFLRSQKTSYKQGNHEHVPYLSMIDVLMFNSIGQIRKMLCDYELE